MAWLVTGGCGFVGSNLAAEQLKHGSVIVVDNLFRTGSKENKLWLEALASASENTLYYYNCDVGNRMALEQIFSKHRDEIECVAHLAGQVAMTTSLAHPDIDFNTNALGTFNVLECVRAYCPDATVMYSSTNKVYGDFEWIEFQEADSRYQALGYEQGFDENIPLDFSTPYGCSKGAADQYIRDWSRCYGLKTVVFRHSSMYGGRQFASYDQGWIGWFCSQAMLQKKDSSIAPFTISGNGKQVRDVLFSSDLVNLYRMTYQKIDDVAGQIFNIGGGMENSLSLLELFSMLEELLDLTIHYSPIEWRKSDQKVFVADISKAERLIGWNPKVDCKTGLRHMVSWLESLERSE